MDRKIRIKNIAAIIVIATVILSFLPIWPVVTDAESLKIHGVELYYKGQPELKMDDHLELDNLEVMLQLYRTSLLPTLSRSQFVSPDYYVISGSQSGKGFTITADLGGAYMFRGDRKMGWRLKNGDTMVGMIYSCYRGELRETLLSVVS